MADVMPAGTHGAAAIFLELRKRLQSGLLIVRKSVSESAADVQVRGGDSSICIRTPEGEVTVTLPTGITFEQGSCISTPAGASCNEELHFRLRLDVGQSPDEETPDSVMETLQAKGSYCFHCRGCMSRLLEDRVFKRVLPLPNGNWNAIVDDWCCHPDPFAKKLLPRADDCLLGDTFVLLTRDDGCQQTLTQEVMPVGTEDGQDPKKPCRRLALISCTSCSLVLGEAVAPGTLKLYITQVVVEPAAGDRKPEASLHRSLFVERTVAARLRELSDSLSTFHFSVQTPDEKAFLLLWLLNTDSVVASVLQTSVGGEGATGSSPRAAAALKLLYIACSDAGVLQRDEMASWEVRAMGHPVVLPLEVCQELLGAISESNCALPASMRSMRSYKVAYLRL